MYEYKEVHFQRKEFIVVGRDDDGEIAEVNETLRPLHLSIRVAELIAFGSGYTYTVEDADTGEVMWPKDDVEE